jgi:tetratricopeptide (TPR) repeat protein
VPVADLYFISEKCPCDQAWNNKGDVLAKLGKYEEAIECYDKALQINPNDDQAWNSRCWALDKLCRYDEAKVCYDEAIKAYDKRDMHPGPIDPGPYLKAISGPSPFLEKAFLLTKLGRYEEAVECYDKIPEIYPKDTCSWFNRAITFDELGRYDEALKCYDKANEIDPNDANAWYNKGMLLIN